MAQQSWDESWERLTINTTTEARLDTVAIEEVVSGDGWWWWWFIHDAWVHGLYSVRGGDYHVVVPDMYINVESKYGVYTKYMVG
jgi:hypothetical protein